MVSVPKWRRQREIWGTECRYPKRSLFSGSSCNHKSRRKLTTREVECAKQNSVACFVCHLERRHKYVLITVFLNRVVLSKLQSLLRNGHQNTVESASLAGKWHGCSAGKQSFGNRWLRKPLQTRPTWMLVIVSNDCLWALPPLWNKHFVRRKKMVLQTRYNYCTGTIHHVQNYWSERPHIQPCLTIPEAMKLYVLLSILSCNDLD